jgi:hypothetical protein
VTFQATDEKSKAGSMTMGRLNQSIIEGAVMRLRPIIIDGSDDNYGADADHVGRGRRRRSDETNGGASDRWSRLLDTSHPHSNTCDLRDYSS